MDIKRLVSALLGQREEVDKLAKMHRIFSPGLWRAGYNRQRGLTLLEILISVFLLSTVFAAIFALYNSSQVFYLSSNADIIISYELQYALDHIYKYAMQAIGDETSPPGSSAIELQNPETLNFFINGNDPLTQANYGNTVTYRYRKNGDALEFSTNGSTWESLIPKITVTAVNFTYINNLLSASITGRHRDRELTFYASCYPRLASF